MLLRHESSGIRLISQPAHAWVSGQFARRWDTTRFGPVEPCAEVCLATELHDIGFLEWEAQPTFDPATGLPHSFMEMPAALHYNLWRRSVRDVLSFHRYAALLVSMHFYHLAVAYADPRNAGEAEARRLFMREQEVVQATLVGALQGAAAWAPHVQPECLHRNQRLLAHWDWLSLRLLLGLRGAETMEDVPASDGTTTLMLEPASADGTIVRIHPWPFKVASWELTCDGRCISESFPDEATMREGLARAPLESLSIRLEP